MTKKPINPLLGILFSEQLAATELWLSKAEELLAAARLLETEVVAYWSETEMKDGKPVPISTRPNPEPAAPAA